MTVNLGEALSKVSAPYYQESLKQQSFYFQ